MKGVSTSVGSFLLVILIASFMFYFNYISSNTFNSLKIYIDQLSRYEGKNSEKLSILYAGYDRYFPDKLEPIKYDFYTGNIEDLISENGYFSIFSYSGNISFKVYFSLESTSLISVLELKYRLLSNSNATILIKALDENLILYSNSLQISQTFKDIELMIQKELKSKVFLFCIFSNSTILIDLKYLSIKLVNPIQRELVVYLLNQGVRPIKLVSAYVYNSTYFERHDLNLTLLSFILHRLLIKSEVENPHLKLVSELGNTYLVKISV